MIYLGCSVKLADRKGTMETRYTVNISGNKISYSGMYECEYCGYVDNDMTMFTNINEKLYCSLHTGESNE
jgi:hypothetical protein